MKRIPGLPAFLLFGFLSACGKSSAPSSADPTRVDDSAACTAVRQIGLVQNCRTSPRGDTLHVVITTGEDQQGREACVKLAAILAQLPASANIPPRLEIYSPFREDKALAHCTPGDTSAY